MSAAKITPCANCPWRVTTPERGFPGGIVDARALMAMFDKYDGKAMGCHARTGVCVGFALAVGDRSPGYQKAVALGLVDPEALDADGELHDLMGLLRTHGGKPHPERRG